MSELAAIQAAVIKVLAFLGLGSLGGRVAWIIGIGGMLYKWYVQNESKIAAIVIRIEKEKADANGWTAEEKEQLAVDVFMAELYPLIPIPAFIKGLVKPIIVKWIKVVISKLCKKAKDVKSAVQVEMSKP